MAGRCGSSFGRSATTVTSACATTHPRAPTRATAAASISIESRPRLAGSVSANISPMSPAAAAPRTASVSACATASPSECPASDTSAGMLTPPRSSGPVNDSTQAIPAFAAQFRQMAGMTGAGPAWLVTHVPTWTRDFPGQADSIGAYILQSALRQASPNGELPAAVGLSLVGHVHAWEALDFAAPRAPVLVLGDGGTSESEGLPTAMPSQAGGVAVDGYWSSLAFGYTVLDADGAGGWRATLVPLSGTGAAMTCTLRGGQMAC